MFIYVLLLGLLFAVCYFGVANYYINLPEDIRPDVSSIFWYAIGWTVLFLIISWIIVYGGREIYEFVSYWWSRQFPN